ncbi:MAG: hypothetical protein NTW16_07710 [Bacteroidetes bacterium]|nr:hypothetical protein [Bacteroidota bacterium]
MSKALLEQRKRQPSFIKKPDIKEKHSVPFWQSSFFWLILLPAVLYAKIIFFDFTALDDQFFVVDHASFNENIGNIFHVFNQGLFVPKNDIYYRPVLLVDLILEYQLFGIKPWGYHLLSMLFHIISTCLLLVFLKKINIPEVTACILSLVFSVHPVLTQTVAWIPGRNDLILMILFLSTLIIIIKYFQAPSIYLLFGQFITFFLALLTKETAVIIPLISFLVIHFVLSVRISKMMPIFLSWVIAVFIWYVLRATSEPAYQGMLFQEMILSGIARTPAILQYLGKIFFPFNLSAVPQFEEITLIWGLIAIALLIMLVIVSKSYKKPLVIIGMMWYLLFLLPVLIIPKNLNDQVYEHRLYLPFVGILLVLSQTLLFSEKWKKKNMIITSAAILSVLITISFIRLDCYHDRQIFWDTAVTDSPKSAFAKLNQGIQSKDTLLREKYIKQAYAIDPNEMLVNFWMGINEERKSRIDSAVYYYKKELAWSNFPDLYFNLSRCLFELNMLDSAAWYLSKGINLDPSRKSAINVLADVYFKLAESSYSRAQYDSAVYYLTQVTIVDPKNEQANHNLAMVYFQTNRRENAMQMIEHMRLIGLPVSQDLLNLAK